MIRRRRVRIVDRLAGNRMEKSKVKSRKAAVASPPSPVRERVLNAAFAAFMENGYTGTSTLEIATRAKVSKRELYQVCADKAAAARSHRRACSADAPAARPAAGKRPRRARGHASRLRRHRPARPVRPGSPRGVSPGHFRARADAGDRARPRGRPCRKPRGAGADFRAGAN